MNRTNEHYADELPPPYPGITTPPQYQDIPTTRPSWSTQTVSRQEVRLTVNQRPTRLESNTNHRPILLATVICAGTIVLSVAVSCIVVFGRRESSVETSVTSESTATTTTTTSIAATQSSIRSGSSSMYCSRPFSLNLILCLSFFICSCAYKSKSCY